MPAVSLSPIFNGWQGFSVGGLPLSGGKLYSYLAGTSTPHNTYTTVIGNVANSNPIILQSDGRPQFEIWLELGIAYKFVLTDALGLSTLTYDNISGIGEAADDLRNDLAASSGSNLIGFLQTGTGAVPRTLQSKDRDVVSVKDFGATGDGTTDDTTAIQTALDSGHKSVFVPEGNYKYSTLTMPSVVGFEFYGTGVSSVLVQTGAGIKYPTLAMNCLDSHSTIRDLAFDGTNGTGNTLDTTFAQTLDLLDLFFTNIPTGFSSVKLDGNPTSGTYMHDVRVKNLRIYHASASVANAGIALGAYASDTAIDGFIMNGNFTTNYCIYATAGAQTVAVSNSHIYNAKLNVVYLAGSNGNMSWDNCIFDNALQDLFYSVGSSYGRFDNVWFESINVGKNAIVFDNSYQNILVGTSFNSPFGVANACAVEINGSSGNKLIGGTTDALANYAGVPFDLSGSGSYAKGFQLYASYDSVYSLAGTIQAAQLQNTATNLGANGSGALNNTAWLVPVAGRALFATIYVDNTPAVGQTFTFNLQKNGATIGTGVVNNGSFGVTITLSPTAAANAVLVGDQISIQSVFSLTSGSASPRYAVTLVG